MLITKAQKEKIGQPAELNALSDRYLQQQKQLTLISKAREQAAKIQQKKLARKAGN